MHGHPHALAGQTVKLSLARPIPAPFGEVAENALFAVEDWWDRVTGGSWMFANGNPAALSYGLRAGLWGLPIDDEVVYGKVDGLGHLIHVSELGEAS